MVRQNGESRNKSTRVDVCVCLCSVVSDSATPWTMARQASLSMGLLSQEDWSGLPVPLGDLPDPEIQPMSSESPALEANSLPLSHSSFISEVALQGTGKGRYFQLMVLGQLDIYEGRRKKKLAPLPHITSHINMHSRLVVDLSVKCTMKFIETNELSS